jgi:hypothetical protein
VRGVGLALTFAITFVAASARAETPPGVAIDGAPLAGRVGEHFYLRDYADEYRLYIGGRAHIDAYAPFGRGVSAAQTAGSGLQPGVFLRRARPELSGEFLGRWQWSIAGEFGRTTVDNGNGQTYQNVCTIAPNGTQTCGVRSAPVEAASYQAQPTDVYLNFRAAQAFNVQAGQIKIPFSLENRSSENITPFLENALPTRAFGAPTVRDLGVMIWGDVAVARYELGVFNGDGPNRFNQDANVDPIGRAFAHPFGRTRGPLERLQIGASGHYGQRSKKTIGYDYPTLTTQEGYAFWRPTYTDSKGNLVHIIPAAAQVTGGGELYWPISIFDLTSEVVYAHHDTREARDGYQISPFTDRAGAIRGLGYYGQLSVWVFGDRQFVRRPGYLDPPHIDFSAPLPPTESSLEVLAKVERLETHYEGASRGGQNDSKTPNGETTVIAISAAVNYWATRRVRGSVDFATYVFPERRSGTLPGLKELSARLAVGF